MGLMNNIILYSIPLSKLAEVNKEFTEEFFTKLLQEVPQMGKIHERYFLINNNLTLNNPAQSALVNYFNNFVQLGRLKAPITQITKN